MSARSIPLFPLPLFVSLVFAFDPVSATGQVASVPEKAVPTLPTAFQAVSSEFKTELLCDVARALPASAPPQKFYIAGIVGNSFATMTNSGSYQFSPGSFVSSDGACSHSLVTGGGAVGLALHRRNGQLRIEVEGRARGVLSGNTSIDVSVPQSPIITQPATTTATDAWSVMCNIWRDWAVTESVDLYGGGGIGFGGYHYDAATLPPAFFPASSSGNVNTFAWQVGTGVTWAASDRVSLDLGYRFFSYGNGQLSRSEVPDPTPPVTPKFYGDTISAFTASELLFTLRIYEPFRGFIR